MLKNRLLEEVELQQAPEQSDDKKAFTLTNIQVLKEKLKEAENSYKALVPVIVDRKEKAEDNLKETLSNFQREANFLYTVCLEYQKIIESIADAAKDLIAADRGSKEPKIPTAFANIADIQIIHGKVDQSPGRDAIIDLSLLSKKIKYSTVEDGKVKTISAGEVYGKTLSSISKAADDKALILFAEDAFRLIKDYKESLTKRIDEVLGAKPDDKETEEGPGGYYKNLTRPLTALEEITANMNLNLKDIDQDKFIAVIKRVEERFKPKRPDTLNDESAVIKGLTDAIGQYGYDISQIEKDEKTKLDFHQKLINKTYPDETVINEFSKDVQVSDNYYSRIVQILVKALKKKGDKEKSTGKKTSAQDVENLVARSEQFIEKIQAQPAIFVPKEGGAETLQDRANVKIDDVYLINNDFFKSIQNDPDQLRILQILRSESPNKQFLQSLPLEKIKKVFEILPKISDEKFAEQKRDLERFSNYLDSAATKAKEIADTYGFENEKIRRDETEKAKKIEASMERINKALQANQENEISKIYAYWYQWINKNKPKLIKYFTTGDEPTPDPEQAEEPEADPEQTEEPEVKEQPEELKPLFADVDLKPDELDALIEIYQTMKKEDLAENKEDPVEKFLQNLPVSKDSPKYQALMRGLRKLQAKGKLEEFAKIIKKPEVKQDSALWSEEQGVELKKRIKDFVKSEEDIKSLKSDIDEFGPKAGSVQKFIDNNWEELIRDFFPSTDDYNQRRDASMKKQDMLYKEFTKMIQDEIEMQSKVDIGQEEEAFTDKDKQTITKLVEKIINDESIIPKTKTYKAALKLAKIAISKEQEFSEIMKSKNTEGELLGEIRKFTNDLIEKKLLEKFPEIAQGKSEVVNYFRKTSERAKDFTAFKSNFSSLLPNEEKTKLSWYRAFTLMLMLREDIAVSENKMSSELIKAIPVFKLDKIKLNKLTQKTLEIINELISKFNITRIKKYIQDNDLLTKIPIVKALPSDFGIKDISTEKEAPSESDPDEQEKEKAAEKVIKKSVEGKTEEAKEDIENSKIFDQQDMEEVNRIPEAVEGLKKYFQFLYKYIKSKEQANENIMSKIRRKKSKESSSAEFFNQLAKYLSQGDERQIGEKIKKKHLELNKDRYTPGKEDGKKREGLFPKLPEILKELWNSDKWDSPHKEAVMDAYKIPLFGSADLTGTLIRITFDYYFNGIVNKKEYKQEFVDDLESTAGLPRAGWPMDRINKIYGYIEQFKKTPGYKEHTDEELEDLQNKIDEYIESARKYLRDEDRKQNDKNIEEKPIVILTRPIDITEIDEVKINKLVKVLKPYLLEKFIRRKQYEKTN